MNGAHAGTLSFAVTDDPLWIGALLVVALVGVVVGVADVRRSSDAAGSRRVHPAWLLVLRIASGVVVALLALQPQWRHESMTTAQGQVALLVDRSRSMTVGGPEASRESQAAELAARWLKEPITTRLYGFGPRLAPLKPDRLLDPSTLQDGTSLVFALEQLARSFGPELGAIVLISDGHDTTDGGAVLDVARVRSLGVKVHTVAVGERQDRSDDAIVNVQPPAVAFAHQETRVSVSLRAPGRVGQSIQVVLRRDDNAIADAVVSVGDDGVGQAEITFVPDRVGRELYRVEIPTAASDPVPSNNERAFVLRIARDRTRVLLVSGRPGWDARFLRGLLNADPAIDLITFFILRTTNDLPMASPEEMSLIPFPTDELFREHLDSFDVVIFQDFEYGPYEMARYLPGVADYVKRGGSFAMVGGSQSFGAGGYARTALAEILPVTLQDGFDAVEGSFRPVVRTQAGEHPIVRLSPDHAANMAMWASVAPVLGMHRFVGLRPSAQVLLVHPGHAPNSPDAAVLVVGSAGEGRVLTLGVDSSWRWGIASSATAGDASVYGRFWDRALRWLTRDPLLEPSQLDTDQERYAPGAPMSVTGTLRDAAYAPLLSVEMSLSVRDKLGQIVGGGEVQTDHAGRIALTLDAPTELGGYRVIATDARGQPLAELAIVVERGGAELADVTAQPDLLKQLSSITGGKHIASIDSAPALADLDRSRSRIAGLHVTAPFKQPWFAVLAVLLLALEWFARRKSGLR